MKKNINWNVASGIILLLIMAFSLVYTASDRNTAIVSFLGGTVVGIVLVVGSESIYKK